MNYHNRFDLVPHKCKDIKEGDTVGRLTILAIGHPAQSYRYKAVCQCTCGSDPLVIRLDAIRSGRTISCGCFQKEQTFKHGLSTHPLYHVLRHMKSRCSNSDDPAFKDYGGRGIRVCERWQSIANFVEDMGDSYQPGLEIERIDNDGNYEPGNCRWATCKEQANNRRNQVTLTFNGQTKSLAAWSEEIGIPYGTLWTRISVKGWSIDRALTTPSLTAAERMKLARDGRKCCNQRTSS